MLPELYIDLDLAPAERWAPLAAHAADARRIAASYVRELGSFGVLEPMLGEYIEAHVAPRFRDDLGAVADITGAPLGEIQLANLYYDAMKVVLMGCTGVAFDGPDGPVHARNLDWWTEERMLSDLTQVVRFEGGGVPGPFELVGWPGFVGAFSGVAEGRFAITLNAVISNDPTAMAEPMTFLIRRAFEECADFDAAVALLRDTPVASDSLLLITGVRPGEMVVIERTPTRAAMRYAEDGVLTVTNDYRALDDGFGGTAPSAENELQRTACRRYDRARELARVGATPADALWWLDDGEVRMAITVQQMAMFAATGELRVQVPPDHPGERA